ncbi:LON peptidase substrate-binding domain-containing protein [Maritimibacter sp. UBA3975]|uniref:LON peptidase substrate-binding domain-containing protein n=1 Tax=Maritimibacter sp. UBA3975 TaxID=1946833 RepID=UPI000C092C0C|nr:LON peptidase substrate-binding domain-containing protein [Maritimibacter sp. UBA3975]MAM62494.1 ATP-dependent protease [Maritimibacter sp.]|tara:strand:+ start:11120 stop:11755 length:636 start_codon:yes stop_codon:yes gene_type:complete
MIPRTDLPEVLPLFPLPGALLLPRGRLPLNIFEPRYLAMFDDALKTTARLIGMIQPAVADGSRLHTIGCAGRITSFTETDDNRYMVQLSGVSRFRLTEEVEGFTPYRRAQVNWDSFERDLGRTEKDPGLDRDRFLDLLARYFDVADLRTDWGSMKDAEDELLINSLSMLCPFDPEDKQALLEAPSLTTRRETLVTLMEFALASGGGEGSLQ